jgi:hypothetical protein
MGRICPYQTFLRVIFCVRIVLRQAVSNLTPDKLILQEAARGKLEAPRVVAGGLST